MNRLRSSLHMKKHSSKKSEETKPKIENDESFETPKKKHSIKAKIKSKASSTNDLHLTPEEEDEFHKLEAKVKERYNDLIKELWNNEAELQKHPISPEIVELLNKREALWLEYFLVNASYNQQYSIFEYLEQFLKTSYFFKKNNN